MHSTTGEFSSQAGICRTTCCGYEIALGKDERFPPCRNCLKGATWVFVRPMGTRIGRVPKRQSGNTVAVMGVEPGPV